MEPAGFQAPQQKCEKRLLASCLPARFSAWNSLALSGRILMKSCFWEFFEYPSKQFKLY